MRTLIQHGTVVTASETFLADVAIDGETIVEIGKDISPEGFDKVVDASGKLVLPGAIDAHTHLAMPFGGTVSCAGKIAVGRNRSAERHFCRHKSRSLRRDYHRI